MDRIFPYLFRKICANFDLTWTTFLLCLFWKIDAKFEITERKKTDLKLKQLHLVSHTYLTLAPKIVGKHTNLVIYVCETYKFRQL